MHRRAARDMLRDALNEGCITDAEEALKALRWTRDFFVAWMSRNIDAEIASMWQIHIERDLPFKS